MEDSITPCFPLKIHRRPRSLKPHVRGASHDAVPNLAVVHSRAEVAKNQKLADGRPSASMKQKTSQAPEETEQSLLLFPRMPVPRGPRSNHRVMRKQISLIQGIGVYKGALKECIVDPHAVAGRSVHKRRKTKITTNKKDSGVTIPRFRCRGQSRRCLGSNLKQELDTNTFDCLLQNLLVEFPEEKRVLFTFLDSLWFALYSSNKKNKPKVLGWITKKDLFAKNYVVVPIVMWSHWSLLILCHFGESGESKTRTPCMLLLDSLQATNPRRLEPEIRRFVLDVCMTQESPLSKEQVKKIPLLVPKVPQQIDDKECGNLVLYYINLFIENAPEYFCISEGYPYFMTENWFTREGVDSFYQRLDSLQQLTNDSDHNLHEGDDGDGSDDIIEL